jgi:hypothetical protein
MFCKMAAYSKQKQVLKDNKVVFGDITPERRTGGFLHISGYDHFQTYHTESSIRWFPVFRDKIVLKHTTPKSSIRWFPMYFCVNWCRIFHV